MAEFGIKTTEVKPLPQRVTVQAGVQTDFSGLRTVASGIRSAFSGSGKKKAADLNPLLEAYTKTSDGVTQGAITQAEAEIRNRATLRDWGARNPNHVAKGVAFTKSYTGGSPAENLTRESAITKQYKSDLAEGAGIGFKGPTTSDDEVVRTYRNYKFKLKELDMAQKRLALIKANSGVFSAAEKRKATKAIGQLVPEHYGIFKNNIQTFITQSDNDPSFKGEAVKQVNEMFSSRFVTIANNARRDGMSQGEIDGFLKPFQDLRDRAIERINGKLDNEVYETQNKLKQNQLTNMILSEDPKALAASVQIKLFGESNFKLLGVANDTYRKTRRMAEGLTGKKTNVSPDTPGYVPPTIPNVTDPHKKKQTKTMSGMTNQAWNRIQKNSPDERKGVLEGLVSEVDQVNTNWLKSFTMYDKTNNSPKDWKEAVKHVATPEFGAWMTKNGKSLPANVKKDAYNSVINNWTNVINPLLKEKINNIKSTAKIGDFVDVTYNSGGVMFTVKDTPETRKMRKAVQPDDTTIPITPKDREAFHANKTEFLKFKTMMDGIDQLNNEVAPLLNTNIRVSSHLTSKNPEDYQGEWERNYAPTFSDAGVEETKVPEGSKAKLSPQEQKKDKEGTKKAPVVEPTAGKPPKTVNPPQAPKKPVQEKTPSAGVTTKAPTPKTPPASPVKAVSAPKRIKSASELEFEVSGLKGLERSKALSKLKAENKVVVAPAAITHNKNATVPIETSNGKINIPVGSFRNAVAKVESGKAGYNSLSGNKTQANVVSMSIDQAIAFSKTKWDGKLASVLGAYQFKDTTLTYLKRVMNLSGKEKMTPKLQDDMAFTLMKRRGLDKFVEGKITKDKFMDNLAKEWASLPLANGKSFYNKNGVDKALMSRAQLSKLVDGLVNQGKAGLKTPAGSGVLKFSHPNQEAGVKPRVKQALQTVSGLIGKPLTINSGHRGANHPSERNKKTPGQHTQGNAVDISMASMSKKERFNLIKQLQKAGFRRFITYKNSPNMLHVDIKPQKNANKGRYHAMFNRSSRNFDQAPTYFKAAF